MFSTFWALQIFSAKLAFNAGAAVLSFQLLSIVVVLATLGVVILPRVGAEFKWLFREQRGLFWKLYLVNGIQAGLGTCLALIGIALTDAINAGFLVKMTAVTTTLLAWVILKERLTVKKIVMVISMLVGAYLLTTKGQALVPQPGDLFILGACVCWSLGAVLTRRYFMDSKIDPDVATLQKPLASFPVIVILVGAFWVFPGVFGGLNDLMGSFTFSPPVLVFGVLSGFCLAMAWIFLNRSLERSTASYMTLMSMLTPVIVSVLALIFLGETLNGVQVAGAALILLSGVVVYQSDMAEG